MTSEDSSSTVQRCTLLNRTRLTNPSHLCITTARRHPASRDRLQAHAAYPGDGHRPAREAGAFAAKAIPSEPMARRSEIGRSALQP